ncbi:hypothetical protein MMC14_009773, partial [Varicellaria rhodocarpa]|nr:hypothetical protein [Varicellaria rhodocarpa]
MWKRQPGQLNYTIISIHKLVPPPSRISNNATVTVLCLAASLWLRCNTDPSRSTLVTSPHHTTTSFAPLSPAKAGKQPGAVPNSSLQSQDAVHSQKAESESGHPGKHASSSNESMATDAAAGALGTLSVKTDLAAASVQPHSPVSVLQSMSSQQTHREDQESLLVMTVSDDGHVWQWDVPLHGFLSPPKSPGPGLPQTAPVKGTMTGQIPTAPAKPALLGLLHTLPHSVTTFSVCPVPVGAGWARDSNQPSGQSGEGGDAVTVLAAVTSAGNVELITLQRGA